MYAGPISPSFPKNLRSAAGSFCSYCHRNRSSPHSRALHSRTFSHNSLLSIRGSTERSQTARQCQAYIGSVPAFRQFHKRGHNRRILLCTQFDKAVSMVKHTGRKAFLCKIDIKHAFRLCPVRVADWPLLCYFWLTAFFVDTVPTFWQQIVPRHFQYLCRCSYLDPNQQR